LPLSSGIKFTKGNPVTELTPSLAVDDAPRALKGAIYVLNVGNPRDFRSLDFVPEIFLRRGKEKPMKNLKNFKTLVLIWLLFSVVTGLGKGVGTGPVPMLLLIGLVTALCWRIIKARK
jgi:hypothetical protein